VLVLSIPATKVVLAGLRTLVAVLLLVTRAAMAIQAITLQGALVVLETILLVPLVTQTRQAIEGCEETR
jgi:hypothetical protein